VVDDVIALLLLSELSALVRPNSVMAFVQPILAAVCFIGGIGAVNSRRLVTPRVAEGRFSTVMTSISTVSLGG
jgi:hypothetical protein